MILRLVLLGVLVLQCGGGCCLLTRICSMCLISAWCKDKEHNCCSVCRMILVRVALCISRLIKSIFVVVSTTQTMPTPLIYLSHNSYGKMRSLTNHIGYPGSECVVVPESTAKAPCRGVCSLYIRVCSLYNYSRD